MNCFKQYENDDIDDLPEFEDLSKVRNDMLNLAPPLISGVLRQGHKMLVAGPSKAGKSFLLIELSISIAEGVPWMGFECTQGKVLYVNLELDRASCLHRFDDVYKAMELPPKKLENIDVWNLRGKALPLDQLVPKLVARAKNKGYIAIIVDPIYKIITGNENSAFEMTQFCNQFDRICDELGCSVIYCHHHSKGDQSWKKSMDRASGSGVFARDADALLDVTELEIPPERRKKDVTAWRVTGTLREFQSFSPVDVWFNYPLHIVEHFKYRIAPHYELDPWERAINGRATKTEKKKKRNHRLEAAFDICSAGGTVPTVGMIAEYLGISKQSVRNSVDEHEGFTRENGKILRI